MRRRDARFWPIPLAMIGSFGCQGAEPGPGAGAAPKASAATSGARAPVSQTPPSATAVTPVATPAATPAVGLPPRPRCRPEMVEVDPARLPEGSERSGASFCVDRFEAVLIDHRSGLGLSPYYSPSRRLAKYAAEVWEHKRLTLGGPRARAMALPPLPAWQLEREPAPRAVVRKGQTPNGHVSGLQAKEACERSGKRLCSPAEWRLACGGEQGWKYPYGPKYEQGRCNVFREAHPAAVLHDDASMGHADPRLNLVTHKGRPLLRKTGATPSCTSKWGDDAIYDLVGNVDEWVDEPKGSFAGGFYARSTREGCDWRSTAHPMQYADYSTGVRCCADLPGPARHGSDTPD